MTHQPGSKAFQATRSGISEAIVLGTNAKQGRGTEMSSVYADPRWINDRPTVMADRTSMAVVGTRNAVDWYRRRRDAQALRRLSDYALKDLGLHRSQIVSLTRGADVEQTRYRNGDN